MRLLFSWIAMAEDLVKSKATGEISGPTLQILKSEKIDALYLFSNDKKSQEKASKLKSYVKENSHEFKINKKIQIHLEYLALKSPADYQNLWEMLPKKVKTIVRQYKEQETEIYFNLSSGTRAMTSTWLMMVGTGEINAKLISPQLDKNTGKIYMDLIPSDIYPYINELKDKYDRDLGLVNKFRSKKMKEIFYELTLLSNSGRNRPILLLGETGTGKTTIAKQFHELSGKPAESFQAVVCGQFVGADLNLTKSLLFGQVKAAYTGAEKREGIFSQANGGTVFLDEIGDIPLEAQRTLIDAVETKKFRPLGSDEVIYSDFQLICATNKDISQMIKEEKIGLDVYARINAYEFTIPPLRERKEDISNILEELLLMPHNKDLSLNESAQDKLIINLKESTLPENIRGVQRILDELFLISRKPDKHNLTEEEINKYFNEHKEPTKDDEFAKTVLETLTQWPETIFSRRGEKWKDKVLDIALNELARNPEYKKKNGDLNIKKLVTLLGVDHKTIKSRLIV